jgi:alkanesulfonate monooxygenase SsuD/methylene tetrahydromethanopterin reductase-like flavin-dependent oxidoreductase (luciferase family)
MAANEAAAEETRQMDTGLALIFQGTDPNRSDLEVYQTELGFGEQAEALGFDSIWSVEHHFTDYTMCPDVMQFLTYFAGKTKKAKLGSMVVVLPWHDPMRVAEQVAMLDNMSNGRVILGIGRGLGRVEFDGFGKDMNASRETFVEAAEMILNGLEKGYCEYDGKFVKQLKRDIRPRPFKSFKGRTYAAAVSPESSQIMAKLGIGVMVIPQKPWPSVIEELNAYRATYRQVNGADAPPPLLASWTYVDKDAGRAEEMARRYIGGYWQTVLKHYELVGDHLRKMKGYEYYVQMQEAANDLGTRDALVEMFLGIQCWGTPEQTFAKIKDFTGRIGADAFTGVFSYAGMPFADAEASLKLFAKEVLPEVKRLKHAPVSLAAE